MPPDPYGQSPVFDETSLPDALRQRHRTKPGTWGLLRVLEGQVRLIFHDPPTTCFVTVGNPATIAPEALHHVETIGAMKMRVEFYHAPPHSERASAAATGIAVTKTI